MKATHSDDQLDTQLLRVDEVKHLGTAVPNVTVLTADGPRELYDLIDEKLQSCSLHIIAVPIPVL